MAIHRRQSSTSLSLPTEVNTLSTDFNSQCAMYFGRKSWGKTTLISQYRNVLVMLLEPARRNLEIRQVPEEGVEHTWDNLVQYGELFMDDPKLEILAIDTADRLYAAALKSACLELSSGQFDTPAKAPDDDRPSYYIYAQKMYEDFLETIKSGGKSWVLTSHDTKRATKHPITGDKEDRIEPTCSPAAWKIAQSMCDYVFHVEFLKRQRVVCVRDIENISIASCGRGDVFLDPDGKKISRFAMPNDATQAFKTMQAAYDNKLRDLSYEEPAKPLKSASPAAKSKVNGVSGNGISNLATKKKSFLTKKG